MVLASKKCHPDAKEVSLSSRVNFVKDCMHVSDCVTST
jgi:hypothetical protein